MRSRAVLRPLACCFSTAFADPACTASSRRRSRSASLPAVVWMSMSSGTSVPSPGCPVRSLAVASSLSRCANLVPMTSDPAPRPPLDPDRLAAPRRLAGRGRRRRRPRPTRSSPSAPGPGSTEGLVVVTEHQTRRPRPPRPRVGDAARQLADLLGAAAARRSPPRPGRGCPLLTGYAVQAALADRLPTSRSSGPTTCWSTSARSPASWSSGSTRPTGRRPWSASASTSADPRGAAGRAGHLARARDRRARRPHRPARPGARLPARAAGRCSSTPRHCGRRTPTRARPSDASSTCTCRATRCAGRGDRHRRARSLGGELGGRHLHRRRRRCDPRPPPAVT